MPEVLGSSQSPSRAKASFSLLLLAINDLDLSPEAKRFSFYRSTKASSCTAPPFSPFLRPGHSRHRACRATRTQGGPHRHGSTAQHITESPEQGALHGATKPQPWTRPTRQWYTASDRPVHFKTTRPRRAILCCAWVQAFKASELSGG